LAAWRSLEGFQRVLWSSSCSWQRLLRPPSQEGTPMTREQLIALCLIVMASGGVGLVVLQIVKAIRGRRDGSHGTPY
jgi:hypothetical protein